METSSKNLFSRTVVHNFSYHEDKFLLPTFTNSSAPLSVATFYYKFKMHKSFIAKETDSQNAWQKLLIHTL